MYNYDYLIIGFGKCGKTFAQHAQKLGYRVALIEKNVSMYGGTCINVGCIPSKTLKHHAKNNIAFEQAIDFKNKFISKLRNKNYQMLIDAGVTLIDGEAHFIDNHSIKVNDKIITAKTIIINTGSLPIIPHFEGVNLSNVYDSTKIMEQQVPFNHLVIIGGGYIGLEMGSILSDFNKKITIIEKNAILSQEDLDIKNAILNELNQKLEIIEFAQIEKFDGKTLYYIKNNETKTIDCDALLLATARSANIQSLQLENTSVTLTPKNKIEVNTSLQTNAENIYAVGDTIEGMNFTYTSLDDYRILVSHFFEQKDRTTQNRGAIPYSLFITPVYSAIGLNETMAKKQNIPIKVAKLLPSNTPRANITQEPQGLMKAIIHAQTNEILGACLFCVNSEEIINLIKIAIDSKLPYTYFKNMIFTHPSMAENLNELFKESNFQ